ncbi:MAG: type II toxin-antitoxin system VapB family antitoxin [Methylococcales bacterium]|jgi:Arc/MetJ family transcription regulator|nr:MAG: type II toxin-antitoxin system VapB family antitoxin [Methylococcales bacterium]
MKITLNLPDDLMKEAMSITDIKTKTGVIIVALKELIRKDKVAKLKNYKGTVNLEMDIDILRNRDARSR